MLFLGLCYSKWVCELPLPVALASLRSLKNANPWAPPHPAKEFTSEQELQRFLCPCLTVSGGSHLRHFKAMEAGLTLTSGSFLALG